MSSKTSAQVLGTFLTIVACYLTGVIPVFSNVEAYAEEAALTPPQQIIARTSEEVREALRRRDFRIDMAQATQIVKEILEPHVDFNRVALFILGKHWRTATPEQRERFKDEFRTLLIRSYTTAFTEYKDWSIRILPMQWNPGDKTAMVRTEVLQTGAKPLTVAYRMAEQTGEWKAFDLMIEGISLVQNYRTTFGSEIEKTGSLDGVIRSLAERNAAAAKDPGRKGLH